MDNEHPDIQRVIEYDVRYNTAECDKRTKKTKLMLSSAGHPIPLETPATPCAFATTELLPTPHSYR